MLIFHEGLPGSGKSYAAMADHIIPALQKGRAVYAYIEGLNHEKIAEAAGLNIDVVKTLLVQITREEVPQVYRHVKNDALVVLDEAQNFWPDRRQPLTPEITQFVTEHRHRGLDVLLMGQVFTDVHKLWRGRVDTLIVFRKLDAIGKPTEYRWSVQKQDSRRKFKETTSGKKPYDVKYFGTYASHTEGTENLETYKDDRANVKNSAVFRKIKLFGLVMLAALAFLGWLFYGGGLEGSVDKKPLKPVAVAVPEKPPVTKTTVVHTPAPAPVLPAATEAVQKSPGQAVSDVPAQDFIVELSEKNRIRLSGTIRSATKTAGSVEWRDSNNRLIERLSFEDLHGFGWYVMVSTTGNMATLSRPGKTYVATAWPIGDDREKMPSKVPEATIARMRDGQQPYTSPEPVKLAELAPEGGNDSTNPRLNQSMRGK